MLLFCELGTNRQINYNLILRIFSLSRIIYVYHSVKSNSFFCSTNIFIATPHDILSIIPYFTNVDEHTLWLVVLLYNKVFLYSPFRYSNIKITNSLFSKIISCWFFDTSDIWKQAKTKLFFKYRTCHSHLRDKKTFKIEKQFVFFSSLLSNVNIIHIDVTFYCCFVRFINFSLHLL